MKLTLALMLLGSSALVANNSNAAQALAVASNGKWAVGRDRTTDVKGVSAQALAKCKTRGGTDPKIVYTGWQNAHAAIAVSDNGTGTVVGWAFKPGSHITNVKVNPVKQAEEAALQDCQKKGGKNPKVVSSW
jgi:hypothetical protein